MNADKRVTCVKRLACMCATTVAAIVGAFLCGCTKTPKPTQEVETESHEPTMLFGIAIDTLDVERNTVGQGQMISQILTQVGVPYPAAIATYDKARPQFDFRRMKAGGAYYTFVELDSARTLRHFVYEISPTSYVRVSYLGDAIGDSIAVTVENQPVETVQRMASVSIETSLWNAMTDAGVAPQVVLDLSDVFAWTVDFFGLERGDSFSLIYDEKRVGDKVVGTGNIAAAVYVHNNVHSSKRQYAFRHETDSTAGYYDLKGNSMRRAFLKAPLHFSRISSRFSNGRLHPVLKIRRPHHGVDYAAPKGTPVVSIGDGKVIAKGYDSKGGGNYVKIKHNSIYTTVYMHLNSFARGLSVGSSVRQGELIGTVGATGLATGPHLDFRVYREGHPIDPLKIEMPPAEPIDNDAILEFMEVSERQKEQLDSLERANKKQMEEEL